MTETWRSSSSSGGLPPHQLPPALRIVSLRPLDLAQASCDVILLHAPVCFQLLHLPASGLGNLGQVGRLVVLIVILKNLLKI